MKILYLIISAAISLALAPLHAKGECKQELKDLCQGVTKGDKVTLATCFSWAEDSPTFGSVSEGCKNKLAREREKNEKLMATCAPDHEKLCPDEKPGNGEVMRCLKKRVSELSADCKDAIDKTPVRMK